MADRKEQYVIAAIPNLKIEISPWTPSPIFVFCKWGPLDHVCSPFPKQANHYPQIKEEKRM
jgi:hypothetical protein